MGGENKLLTVYANKKIGAGLCTLKINAKLGTHLKSIQLDGSHVMFVDFSITCFVLESLKPQFQIPRTNTSFSQCVFKPKG